jgi:hypothetical protein
MHGVATHVSTQPFFQKQPYIVIVKETLYMSKMLLLRR